MAVSNIQWNAYLRNCENEKRARQPLLKSTQEAKIGWNVVHQLTFEDANIQRWRIFLETGNRREVPVRQNMFARYIGLIDKHYNITPAGKKLLSHGMRDVWQQQIEKWYYCVDDFFRLPNSDYNLYPFFALLKILLTVGNEDESVMPRYSISLDEFRFFVVTIKDHSECDERKERIVYFRRNSDVVLNELLSIFGDRQTNDRTCYDRVIHLLERSDYLEFTSDRIILKNEKLNDAKQLIKNFERLINERSLPMYRMSRAQYFDMLYSEDNIFQHLGVDIDNQIESLVDESISIIKKTEDFTDKDETDYEEKVDKVIPKKLTPEEKEERARKFLEKYKKKAPEPPKKLTKAYVTKIERGPVGRAMKDKYNSICQVENCRYTFIKKDGSNYAEAHHLEDLGKGGKDIEENIVVLCANCHRKLHYATVEKVSQDTRILRLKINDEIKTIRFK